MSLWQVRGIVKAARELDPALKVGMMLADQLTYAKTCDPQNVKIAIEKNRMKDFFFADVQLRGEYPGYAKTWFKKHGITIQMEDGDEELIRSYTMDFLAVAYYYSHCVDENGNRCANPYTKATEWGLDDRSGWIVQYDGTVLGSLRRTDDDCRERCGGGRGIGK